MRLHSSAAQFLPRSVPRRLWATNATGTWAQRLGLRVLWRGGVGANVRDIRRGTKGVVLARDEALQTLVVGVAPLEECCGVLRVMSVMLFESEGSAADVRSNAADVICGR